MTDAVVTQANATYRDFVVDGDAASGPNYPSKSDIRALWSALMDRVNAEATGTWTPPGTGGQPVVIGTRLSYEVYADDYKSPSDPDWTAAIQRAANKCAANNGGNVLIRPGTYNVSSTINLAANVGVIGMGAPDSVVIYRTGDYGSTFTAGDPAGGAGATAVTFKNLFFIQGPMYVAGSYTLANKMTHGAHIELWGAQNCDIDHVYFWRGTYAIIFHGGALLRVSRCLTGLCWDPLHTAAQEGLAAIACDPSTPYGNPKQLFLTGNVFMGADNYPYLRNQTYTDSYGRSKTINVLPFIGPQTYLQISGCEGIQSVGNYYGNASDTNVSLAVSNGGFIAEAQFVGDFFDGAHNSQLRTYLATTTETPILNLQITNCKFNGEKITPRQIELLSSGVGPSVNGVLIDGCILDASLGAGIIVQGATNWKISDTLITNYNYQNVSPNTAPLDPYWAAAVYCYAPSTWESDGVVDGATIGGTYTYLGVVKDTGADKVFIGKVYYNSSGVSGAVGFSQGEVLDVATTSTLSAYTRTYFTTQSSAITLTLPSNVPRGHEITIIDAANAGTNAVTISGGTINGSSSYVISTQGGGVTLVSAGGSVWKIKR